MSADEIEELISEDIDITRVKLDSEGILGQYVRLRGYIDLEGNKEFPLNGFNDNPDDDNLVFFMEDIAYVMPTKPCPKLKHGDMVEVIGLVSESRFLKTIAELYPNEKVPDMVTILAWDVKVINEEQPVDDKIPIENESKESSDVEKSENKKPDE